MPRQHTIAGSAGTADVAPLLVAGVAPAAHSLVTGSTAGDGGHDGAGNGGHDGGGDH